VGNRRSGFFCSKIEDENLAHGWMRVWADDRVRASIGIAQKTPEEMSYAGNGLRSFSFTPKDEEPRGCSGFRLLPSSRIMMQIPSGGRGWIAQIKMEFVAGSFLGEFAMKRWWAL
jgi:hypothetical protein